MGRKYESEILYLSSNEVEMRFVLVYVTGCGGHPGQIPKDFWQNSVLVKGVGDTSTSSRPCDSLNKGKSASTVFHKSVQQI